MNTDLGRCTYVAIIRYVLHGPIMISQISIFNAVWHAALGSRSWSDHLWRLDRQVTPISSHHFVVTKAGSCYPKSQSTMTGRVCHATIHMHCREYDFVVQPIDALVPNAWCRPSKDEGRRRGVFSRKPVTTGGIQTTSMYGMILWLSCVFQLLLFDHFWSSTKKLRRARSASLVLYQGHRTCTVLLPISSMYRNETRRWTVNIEILRFSFAVSNTSYPIEQCVALLVPPCQKDDIYSCCVQTGPNL